MTFLELGLLRLIVPLAILRFPLPGIIAAQLLDKYDWKLLPFASESDYVFYQYWDKSLDMYYLTLALIVTRRWPDQLARRVAVATYTYRAVGVGLFFVVGDQRLFLLFPNVFEGLFIVIEVFMLITGGSLLFRSTTRVAWVVSAVSLPRWVREYFIHVAEEWPWQMWTVLDSALDVRLWQGTYIAFPVMVMVIALAREKRRTGRIRRPLPGFRVQNTSAWSRPAPVPKRLATRHPP